MAVVNSSMRSRIVLDGLFVLLSSGTLGRIEDASSESSYVVLTNSSYIRKIVISAIWWWDSLTGNVAVVDFMKKSIDCIPMFSTLRQIRATVIQRTRTWVGPKMEDSGKMNFRVCSSLDQTELSLATSSTRCKWRKGPNRSDE